jgi:membrane protein required for colicin V production
MSHLDYIIIGIVLLSSLFGFSRGLVRESFSLVAWVSAFLFGIWFGQIAAFLIVIVATLALASMIQWGLGQLVTRTGLSSTDRFLGLLFGAARGGLVVTILLMVSQSLFSNTDWWADSELKYNFLQFEDEVLMLVDIASDSLEDPPPAPELPSINMPDLAPPDIEIDENLDDVDYFED